MASARAQNNNGVARNRARIGLVRQTPLSFVAQPPLAAQRFAAFPS
jgi:hypothetical protein